MANIYLRVSKYVAAFVRTVDEGTGMPPNEPVVFSPYTEEYRILESSLMYVTEDNQHVASCYSESAWKNMLCGRKPSGGKAILPRNKEEYLNYNEVCAIEGYRFTSRNAYDFLCIAMPQEIFNGQAIVRSRNTFTLSRENAFRMRRLLRNTFVRTFLTFVRNNEMFAEDNNISRSDVEIMERFFLRYNIPITTDGGGRNTMRRLLQRWREEAERLYKAPTIIGDKLITRIDEHERRGGLPKYH